MVALFIERAGPRTTVQDLGRPGWAHLGIPRAGAVDRQAHALANARVGNSAGAASLEVTLGGLRLRAVGDIVVAWAGARVAVRLDGRDVTGEAAVAVAGGQQLAVGRAPHGVYVYVAVRGGIDVPVLLGSRSSDTLSGIGSAAVVDGVRLPVGSQPLGPSHLGSSHLLSDPGPIRTGDAVRLHPGPHPNAFGPDVFAQLLQGPWTVSSGVDRTAARLSGPVLPARAGGIASEGLVEGAVQVPPDGRPIVFLANHPTTGGYPVVAAVDRRDIGVIAQTRPGAPVRFVKADA
jgi:biotin-dependent carboxylase-like uncharacterized protein